MSSVARSKLGKSPLSFVLLLFVLTLPSLMALLELCDVDYFSCSRLALCIDRQVETSTMDSLVKDLGWIGFKLSTLSDFTQQSNIVSDRWVFMTMET